MRGKGLNLVYNYFLGLFSVKSFRYFNVYHIIYLSPLCGFIPKLLSVCTIVGIIKTVFIRISHYFDLRKHLLYLGIPTVGYYKQFSVFYSLQMPRLAEFVTLTQSTFVNSC